MDQDGFRKLWLPLHGTLYKAACYILEDKDLAKDVVQDLYVKLWRMGDRLDEVRNPQAFSLTLLRNSCLDLLRSLQYRSERMSTDLPESLASGTEVSAQLEGLQLLKRVEAALEALPPPEKEALTQRAYEDLSYKEMARRSGKSELYLRVLVSSARKKLRIILAKEI